MPAVQAVNEALNDLEMIGTHILGTLNAAVSMYEAENAK